MPKRPLPLIDPQELARRNNDKEAIYRAYLRRKAAIAKPRNKPSKRQAKSLENLLWSLAEREAKPTRAVGFFLPK